MNVGSTATGFVLSLAIFSLAAPVNAQRAEPAYAEDRSARADAAAVQAYVAAQQADPLAPIADPDSRTVSLLSRWVTASGDNKGRPFIIVDKTGAEVFVFDARGQSVGQAPALLGITPGDESVPGVGDRELRKIPVADRTTPAGRFVAKYGPASGHKSVLWVDYGSSVSLHPVISSSPREQRIRRIKSLTPNDNRITYGCINVPAPFYAKVVHPLFKGETGGVVYILPDTRPLNEVFPAVQLQHAAL